MKMNKILTTLLAICPIISTPSLFTISGCSSSSHTNMLEKTKQILDTSEFAIILDNNNYTVEDFNVTLTGNDCFKLIIVYIRVNDNVLYIYVKPKTKPLNDKTTFNFNIKISCKSGWDETQNNINLIYRIVDEQIKAHDSNSWFHAIEHIASCKHPTLYFGGGASYYLQQMLNLYFASNQLAIQKNYIYTNPGYEFNDQIVIVPFYMYKYKTNEKHGTYLTYEWKTMVDSTFGYSDILKTNPLDLNIGNNMIVTNLQDLDTSLSDYDETLESYVPCVDGTTTYLNCKIVNKLMDLYEQINPDVKFNYVIMDFGWDEVSKLKFNAKTDDEKKLAEEIINTQIRMMKHQDKMYILSDGSYTWNTENKNYRDFYVQQNYVDSSSQNEVWNKIVSSTTPESFELYKNLNNWFFFNNENFCYHFAPTTTTSFAPSNLNTFNCLTSDTTYKFTNSWILPDSYKLVFNDEITFKRFSNSILTIYNFYNTEESPTQTFADYIQAGSYRDGSQKNLIFLMPSALTPSQGEIDDKIFNKMKVIINKIKTNYPTDNWNYIFKFHPRADKEKSIKIIKKLFDIAEGSELPDYCIILKGKYAFEYLVELDQYLAKNTSDKKYHLIDPTTLTDAKPSGILTGFDLNSTSYYATISMLSKEYNIDIKNALNLVQNDAFYLSKNLLVPNYEYSETNDFSNQNIENLKSLYTSLFEMNEFKDPECFNFIDK